MKVSHHNDFEIIDRIKQGDEFAFELLVAQYKNMIKKKIHKFNLAYKFDDLFQEGLMVLHKTAFSYDDNYSKSFTRFFEMALERHYVTMIRTMSRRKDKLVKYKDCIASLNHVLEENSVYYGLHVSEIKKVLTELEFMVYALKELKNVSISSIAEECQLEEKKIYNALHRSKEKIKAYFGAE